MTLQSHRHAIPMEILALSRERDLLRRMGKYERADALKRQIEEAGFAIKDNPHGAHLVILPGVEVGGQFYRTSRQVPSFLDSPDTCTFSLNILASNAAEQVRRCVESVLRFAGHHALEIVLLDNASQDETALWADGLQQQEPRLLFARATRPMGEAEARNVAFKLSRGRYILWLDGSVELTGDIFAPLYETLADDSVGVTGWQGLLTEDLRHFRSAQEDEVDALADLCLAFRRTLLKEVGLLDERYRYRRYLDIDFCFAIRATGARAVVTPGLPLVYTPVERDARFSEAERARLTRRNFYRFLGRWGHRDDLLRF